MDTDKNQLFQRFRGFLPVVVDVETGGFDAKKDALLEIAMVTITMDEEGYLVPDEEMDAHIQPFDGANIEQSAIDFTGIDPFDPEREALAEKDALHDMFSMVRRAVKRHNCTRAVLVGHNAHFDHGFLKAATERAEVKRDPFHPFSCFDTASLAGLALGHTVLAKACKIAGIPFDNREAHSALYDTRKTAELFCKIVNQWKDLGGWEWTQDMAYKQELSEKEK